MNMRVAFGLSLLFVECIAVGLATARITPVVVPLATALVLIVGRRRVHLTMRRYVYTLSAMALLAVLWWAVHPPRSNNPLHMFPVTGSSFLFVAALYCIWHQTVQLVVEVRLRFATRTGPFPSFPFVGAFAIAIAGHYSYWATRHPAYAAVAAAYVALTACYYLARDGEWMFTRYSTALKVFSAVLLALTITVGMAAAGAIRQNEAAIDAWLDQLTITPPAESARGFSREGLLSNVTERRGANDQRPALFVRSARVPGYLRGLAFDTYRDGRWGLPNPERWLQPEETTAPDTESAPNRRFFRIGEDAVAEPAIEMEIYTTTSLLDTMFLPASATGVFVDTESLALDRANIVRETKPERRPGYTAVVPAAPAHRPPTDAERMQYTLVPPVNPRIEQLAAKIMKDASTVREKALAVENYFVGEYDYKLGIHIPAGEDPLTHFLLEKPDAHCEYFATGAAILLRLAGVPARYVTGFVAVERNGPGGFYVARNQDAHAWVEAWDPETGWFVVEATPPAGVPEAREASQLAAWRDALTLAWSRFRDRLGTNPLDAVIEMASALMLAIPVAAYGAILGVLVAGFAALRYARARRRPAAAPVSDDVRRLHGLVERADALARAWGFVRATNETVRQFAERIAASDAEGNVRELAEWYREYERVRYRDTANESAHAFLVSALPAER